MFCGPETVDVSLGVFYYMPRVKEMKKYSELHTKILEVFY